MALKLHLLFSLSAALILMQTPAEAANCTDCFIQSRATYYANSNELGTDCKRITESTSKAQLLLMSSMFCIFTNHSDYGLQPVHVGSVLLEPQSMEVMCLLLQISIEMELAAVLATR